MNVSGFCIFIIVLSFSEIELHSSQNKKNQKFYFNFGGCAINFRYNLEHQISEKSPIFINWSNHASKQRTFTWAFTLHNKNLEHFLRSKNNACSCYLIFFYVSVFNESRAMITLINFLFFMLSKDCSSFF